jgi:hypothetical protein
MICHLLERRRRVTVCRGGCNGSALSTCSCTRISLRRRMILTKTGQQHGRSAGGRPIFRLSATQQIFQLLIQIPCTISLNTCHPNRCATNLNNIRWYNFMSQRTVPMKAANSSTMPFAWKTCPSCIPKKALPREVQRTYCNTTW